MNMVYNHANRGNVVSCKKVGHYITMAFRNQKQPRNKGIYIHETAEFANSDELCAFAAPFQRAGYRLIACERIRMILEDKGLPVMPIEKFTKLTGVKIGDALSVSTEELHDKNFVFIDILVVGGRSTDMICSGLVKQAYRGNRIVLADLNDRKPLIVALSSAGGVRWRHRLSLLLKAAMLFGHEERFELVEKLLSKTSENKEVVNKTASVGST